MKTKSKNRNLICLLVTLLVFFLAVSVKGATNGATIGTGGSVNGCAEGCGAAVGASTGIYDFCYDGGFADGDEIFTCDCSATVGGLVGGAPTRIIYKEENENSYYCGCDGNIKKFYTRDCTSEGTFEEFPENPIYQASSKDYECYDPDGKVECRYNPWTPSRWWIAAHFWYTTPNYILNCNNLQNAGWRHKITGVVLPYNSGTAVSDCGTSNGGVTAGAGGSGGTGGNGPATSGLCGASGCSITLTGSFLRLDVPQNALEGTGTIVTTNNAFPGTVITIAEEDPSFYTDEMNIALSAYELMPQGLAFAMPATITIGYDGNSTENEDNLDIYLYDEVSNGWIAQNAAHDKENDLLSVHVNHLGTYAVMMPVDAEPPVTEDDYQYNNTWINKDALIALKATDDLSGVKETLYCIGNSSCVPEISYEEPISAASEGINYLRYYSIDNANNKEGIKETIIKIDKTPPRLSLTLNPGTIWPPDHKEVGVKVDGYAIDSLSNIKSTKFELIDEYNEVKKTISNFGDILKLTAWRDGNDNDGRTYTINAISTDNAGNNAITSAVVLVPHDMKG